MEIYKGYIMINGVKLPHHLFKIEGNIYYLYQVFDEFEEHIFLFQKISNYILSKQIKPYNILKFIDLKTIKKDYIHLRIDYYYGRKYYIKNHLRTYKLKNILN